MTIEDNIVEMERAREAYWLRHRSTSSTKLRWRAVTVRHCFHVLPGESILEIGAGSGLWTHYLSSVLRGKNPITAAVFNSELFVKASNKNYAGTTFLHITDLKELPANSFDYVVGTSILCHNLYPQNLQAIYRLLKPGGQILFFEANYWNPQVFLKHLLPSWFGEARCQVGLRKWQLMQMASHQGFIHVNIIPYDIVHPSTPRSLIEFVQSKAFVFEHTPIVRDLCGTLYIWARKPGAEGAHRPVKDLAEHNELFGAVSFVIPAYNEEMNIPRLIDSLVGMYDRYIHEIIIVNDNSEDRTAKITAEIATTDPRVKLVNRAPPNGVGRALSDGYAAAAGRYILTMDCDFVQILPEFSDLFDAIARGKDGAIGSRFSHDSVLINYPFFKILCNRSFHILVKLCLLPHVRDISNNLKIYRADILKSLKIEEPDFAANIETGLKPLLAGYDIEEVPISWINRTAEMGSSSFQIVKVAPNYLKSLVRIIWNTWRHRGSYQSQRTGKAALLTPEARLPATRNTTSGKQ